MWYTARPLIVWYFSPELGVETWVYKQYAKPNDPDFPPQVLPMADIRCQVARGKIRYTKPPLWITTTMDRVRFYLSILKPSSREFNSFRRPLQLMELETQQEMMNEQV
jgi:hypothetical protein